jgi:TonB family protein
MSDAASEYGYLRPRPRIWIPVAVSLGVHAGAIAAMLFWPASDTRADIPKERAVVTRLVRLGKDLDPKMLPRLETAAPAPDDAVINVNRESQKTESTREKVKEGKVQRDRFARKLASSVDKIRRMLEKTSSRGETGSGRSDGSPDGDATEGSAGDVYLTQVYNYVRNNYSVPSIITESERKNLRATIVIYIDDEGKLVKTEFESRSGNVHFDNALESAVKKASPFPPPPKEKRKEFRVQGIGINFSI